ncbi:hypothetical protein C7M84_018984 [Penaeus vannamei]|uniref:Uncharacterized protein n=1 Tax=Penaeus vannamei TaxID=6689 RepID=A0A3R7P7J7_PENVA|nr:hypothetical protein C7M84_018984 [Penaeus vannamei]
MKRGGWIFNAAVLMAVALSPSVKGEREEAVPAQDDLLPQESQQVAVVAKDDLQASATGYGGYGGGSSHKGHGGGSSHKGHGGYGGSHHDQGGYKGHQGYHADKGHKGSHYGDHGKAHYSGYHGDHGKLYKGHDDKHKYYGDAHSGKKGGKGHHYGSKGHHNKGHKDKEAPDFPQGLGWRLPQRLLLCRNSRCPERMPFLPSDRGRTRTRSPEILPNSGATFRASVDLYMPERDRQLGFKNVYHKEEYGHTKKFYDDSDNKKYHNNYDDLDTYFKAHKGSDYKGGHYKVRTSHHVPLSLLTRADTITMPMATRGTTRRANTTTTMRATMATTETRATMATRVPMATTVDTKLIMVTMIIKGMAMVDTEADMDTVAMEVDMGAVMGMVAMAADMAMVAMAVGMVTAADMVVDMAMVAMEVVMVMVDTVEATAPTPPSRSSTRRRPRASSPSATSPLQDTEALTVSPTPVRRPLPCAGRAGSWIPSLRSALYINIGASAH